EDEERAHEDAYAWIKAVRRLRVDGESFRSRFTLRGDSLWWFAELYLHKEQAVHTAMRVVRAFDTLVERDRPRPVGASERRPARGDRRRPGRRPGRVVRRPALASRQRGAGAARRAGDAAGGCRAALAAAHANGRPFTCRRRRL